MNRALVIDGMNLHMEAQRVRKSVDWVKLRAWAESQGCTEFTVCMIPGRMYSNARTRRSMLKHLEECGYRVVCQPNSDHSPNVNVSVAVEAMLAWSDNLDIVLIGGARAYLHLMETLKDQGDPLMVVADPHSACKELLQGADEFLPMSELLDLVSR